MALMLAASTVTPNLCTQRRTLMASLTTSIWAVGALTSPANQWWTINGQELFDALTRAYAGDDPNLVYMELFANSESERL